MTMRRCVKDKYTYATTPKTKQIFKLLNNHEKMRAIIKKAERKNFITNDGEKNRQIFQTLI